MSHQSNSTTKDTSINYSALMENQQLRENLHEANEKVLELVKKLERKTEDESWFEKKYNQKLHEIERLMKMIESLDDEFQMCAKKMEALETKLRESEDRNRCLEDFLEKKDLNYQWLQSDRNNLIETELSRRKEIAELRAKLASLESKLITKDQLNQHLQEDNDLFVEIIQNLEHELTSLMGNLQNRDERLEYLQKSKMLLDRKIEHQTAELKSLELKVKIQEEQIEKLSEKKDLNIKKIQELTDELTLSKSQIESKDQLIENLQKSTGNVQDSPAPQTSSFLGKATKYVCAGLAVSALVGTCFCFLAETTGEEPRSIEGHIEPILISTLNTPDLNQHMINWLLQRLMGC
ncbi:tropomyosin-1-like [Nothobranchius furzeri]|uniref:tropomyosin-1-like n=1 Tax=Nothobranchius furzeri TaxID=105023 RepID=UPI00390497A4